jgi:methionyl-tRNA synthetase
MLKRVDRRQVQAMMDVSRDEPPVEPVSGSLGVPVDSDEPVRLEPMAAECVLEDFARIDLRVARVVEAAEVPEAKKLLRLTLSLGGDVRRTVFAGIKEAYRPEDLIGRLVIYVANLRPRTMKFGTSEGMVVAAGPGGKEVYLLGVDEGARPGQRIH